MTDRGTMTPARAETDRTIRVEGLVKRYGEVAALDGVSLSIPAGRFMTLLGPSGSGKTTLLMTIAGFSHPDSGRVTLGGRDITPLPPERRNFGMVFQGYALFPHLTVAGNIAFPLKLRGMGRAEIAERVRRALDMVQLGRLGDRNPRQLSGGQQQRVALARALVFEPEVLLLDEPLSALDKALRADLQWELKRLHERLGLTFVYVTHDQEEALSMSDEIAILRDGRIVQQGEPAALYDRPATHFVAGFLGRSNSVEGRLDAGGRPVLLAGGQRLALASHPDLAGRAGERAVAAIRPEKLLILDHPSDAARNRVEGRLLGWNYHGSSIHCRIETSLGIFQAEVPTWQSRLRLGEGRPVWVEWEPEAATLVRDDRPERGLEPPA